MAIIVFIVLMVAGICVYDFIDSRNWQSATSNSRNVVIFENRNKKYGAYNLRSDYNDSFGIILGIFAFSLLVISIINATIRTAPEKVELPQIEEVLFTISAPPVEVAETIKVPYKIAGNKQGGAGAPSSDPVIKTPMEQTQKASELGQTTAVSGQSNKTNAENATNTASSMAKSANPFGPGGATKGNLHAVIGNRDNLTIGPDENGIVPGNVKAKPRKKLTSLNANDIVSNADCQIVLTVYINAEGKVVNAKNDAKLTNTSDAVLISKVIALVKEQIKYEKRAGVSQEIASLPINVSAR